MKPLCKKRLLHWFSLCQMTSILPSFKNDPNSHVYSWSYFWAYACRHVFLFCIHSQQSLKRQRLSPKNILLSELIWPVLTNSSLSLSTLILAHKPDEGDQGQTLGAPCQPKVPRVPACSTTCSLLSASHQPFLRTQYQQNNLPHIRKCGRRRCIFS